MLQNKTQTQIVTFLGTVVDRLDKDEISPSKSRELRQLCNVRLQQIKDEERKKAAKVWWKS